MRGIVSPVLYASRYMLITVIIVVAMVYYPDRFQTKRADADFERVLPIVVTDIILVGLTGLLRAWLLAASVNRLDSSVNAESFIWSTNSTAVLVVLAIPGRL